MESMQRTRKGVRIRRAEQKKISSVKVLKRAGFSLGITCVLAVFLFFGYQSLSRSVFFQVEEVNVTGCQRTSVKQILAWSALDVQTNLWLVRSGRIKARLEARDWIEKVEVTRNWPNKLSIAVRERRPVALVSKKKGLSYVDERGVVFAETSAGDLYDFPVITGLESGQETAAGKTLLGDALFFLAQAGKGAVTLPRQNISEIHLDPARGLILYMADHPFPIVLGQGDMKKKYGRLTRVLSWLYNKKQFEQAESIDMNYLAGVDGEEKRGKRVLVRFAES